MALACNPKILLADEPTTALDVTVQAEIYDLIRDLRDKNNIAIILITHDMGSVAEMAEKVMVMYAGRIIEEGKVENLLQPKHPYTRGLIASVPHLKNSVSKEREFLDEIQNGYHWLHLERNTVCLLQGAMSVQINAGKLIRN